MSEPKPRKYASMQEEAMHELSARIFGTQALFCPDVIDNKEPADIVWAANRCAVLIYMTESGKSFEKKTRHNLAQLHRGIRRWASGQPMTGHSGAKYYSFSYDDVDHIIGLSVIDGADVDCQYHFADVHHSADRKLAACGTITGVVFLEMARKGYGLRDILSIMADLMAAGGVRVSEHLVIKLIRDELREVATFFRDEHKGMWPDTNVLNESWVNVERLRRTINDANEENCAVGDVFADLAISDLVWISVAVPSMLAALAKPGETGPLIMAEVRQSGIYNLRVVACAHMRIAASANRNLMFGDSNFHLLATNDFWPHGESHQTIAVKKVEGQTMISLEAAAIRAASLAYSSA